MDNRGRSRARSIARFCSGSATCLYKALSSKGTRDACYLVCNGEDVEELYLSTIILFIDCLTWHVWMNQ